MVSIVDPCILDPPVLLSEPNIIFMKNVLRSHTLVLAILANLGHIYFTFLESASSING